MDQWTTASSSGAHVPVDHSTIPGVPYHPFQI